ncbi:hypothetical protein [Sphingobacterium siyangense]|uniref:hypothetical protein n=1 Tax=Sphingobacterium siyangense TaxID=459529 RepID=UPI00196585D8|nr:hypothetical protein [Sphingobacterium siyangense]QRY56335.1 hypothetical protein JVX97_20265 [Sphingobacterium siyangense]
MLFVGINRGSTKYGLVSHKPILLLTLVKVIEKGIAPNNRFEVNMDLVSLFQEKWGLLMRTANQYNFTLSIYYFQSDQAAEQSILFFTSFYSINLIPALENFKNF